MEDRNKPVFRAKTAGRELLSRLKDLLLKAGARVQNRNIHPSLSQLLQNPILLDYVP